MNFLFLLVVSHESLLLLVVSHEPLLLFVVSHEPPVSACLPWISAATSCLPWTSTAVCCLPWTSSCCWVSPNESQALIQLTSGLPIFSYLLQLYSCPPHSIHLCPCVLVALHLFPLPCGFQSKNFLALLLTGFINVYPSQQQCLLPTSWFSRICLVLSLEFVYFCNCNLFSSLTEICLLLSLEIV